MVGIACRKCEGSKTGKL